MEKKHKLIIAGSVLGLLAIVLIWVNFFSGSNVDSKTASDAKATAQAMDAQQQATDQPPPPPPPPTSRPKSGIPRK